MKFFVDAQLPRLLSLFLIQKGYDSIHTLDLPEKNATPDHEILKIVASEGRILITKDSDFIVSHLISNKPEKLLLISTGNIDNHALLKIIDGNLKQVGELLGINSFVEITGTEIIAHK